MHLPFQKFGTIKSYGIHYGNKGKPTGTASVTFYRYSAAKQAVKEYNGKCLFGQKMYIRLLTPESRSHQSLHRQPRGTNKPVKRLERGPASLEDRRRHRRTSNKNRKDEDTHKGDITTGEKVALSTEQLDAEMESYLSGLAEGLAFWKQKALPTEHLKLDDFIIIDSTD